jgi:hypothetical protein
VDPATKLTWTLNDNGEDVDWKGAAAYCKALRTAGFSDWRVPSVNELPAIFDQKVTAVTPPTTVDIVSVNVNGAVEKTPAGSRWTYHIKGRIVLTTGNVWTSYRGKPSPKNEAVILSFEDGKLLAAPQ